jgi:hypothetical protein
VTPSVVPSGFLGVMPSRWPASRGIARSRLLSDTSTLRRMR